MTKQLDKPIVIGTPVEIESAVNLIRQDLSVLTYIDKPFFIAQKMRREINKKKFIFPETYAPTKQGEFEYHRLTPDDSIKGMFFFLVGAGTPGTFDVQSENFMNYPVSVIFSVNLEKIDPVKLDNGLFTQELIRDARRILANSKYNHEFSYELTRETRDLQECFREFVLDDVEAYNRAPMQCFRFDLTVTVQEECV